MKVLRQASKINGLQVTEVTITQMPRAPRIMNAVYALGSFKEMQATDELGRPTVAITGVHGRCTAKMDDPVAPVEWSKQTMKLLSELLDSMEEDLLPRHFEETAGMEDTHEGIESGRDEEARQI